MFWSIFWYVAILGGLIAGFIFLVRRDDKNQIHRANELNRIMHQRDADLECWLRDMLKNRTSKK